MIQKANECPVCGRECHGFVGIDAINCTVHGIISGYVAFQLRDVPMGEREEKLKQWQSDYVADRSAVTKLPPEEADAERMWRELRGFRR